MPRAGGLEAEGHLAKRKKLESHADAALVSDPILPAVSRVPVGNTFCWPQVQGEDEIENQNYSQIS